MKKGKNMFYIIIGIIGLLFTGLSAGFLIGKKDAVDWLKKNYISRYYTSDVSIKLLGADFNLSVDRADRMSAWKIYNQIQTRIGAVEFNEEYDSLLFVNKSLHELFKFVRDELSNLPVEKIRRDQDLVKFYHKMLNSGIRPFLSKWHIPVSHYHNKSKGNGKSVLEVEKEFPQRKEILVDMKLLNKRMVDISEKLKKIIEME